MTDKEKLSKAFEETLGERTERLMKIEKKHRFSLSYILWERKMLKDLRRGRTDKRWTLQRAKYAVAAMTVAFALLIGGTAYGTIVISNRFDFKKGRDQTYLVVESYSTDKTAFEELYWLPEKDGWTLANCGVFGFYDDNLRMHFRRGETLVIFYQNLIHEYHMSHIFNEYPDIEVLSVNSENDGFATDHRGEGTTLGWLYDGYYFELICDGMNKDELIELAHTITEVTPEELLKYDDPSNHINCKQSLERLTEMGYYQWNP